MVRLQEGSELRLAPGLSEAIIHPGQYGKMKVNCVTRIFSHSTAAAPTALSASGEIEQNAADRKNHIQICPSRTISSKFSVLSGFSYFCMQKFSFP